MLAAIFLSTIFVSLSAVHWYWVFGGKSGLANVIPNINSAATFKPGPLATAAVAMLLLVAAGTSLAQAELIGFTNSILTRTAVWGFVIIFTARAIGDFRLVGFFKRIKDSRFSRLDDWFYTPLCVIISALSSWLLYLT